jgi:ribulose-phosphate 3-epimerase
MIYAEGRSIVPLQGVIWWILDRNKLAGVAVDPATHPDVIKYVYEEIDLVTLLSDNPGYGGQHFISSILHEINHYMANRIGRLNAKVEIKVNVWTDTVNCARRHLIGAKVF